MKKDIILSGVGGQGILSIATVIGTAALADGLWLKQAEVHGMSQRGGDVQSHLRLSSAAVSSDLIPRGEADMIVSLEPMEALRYLPWLGKEGWIITNTVPFVNIANYPDIEAVLASLRSMKRVILIDVDAIAKELGAPRSANMVLLGAAVPFLGFDVEKVERAVRTVFARKGGDVVAKNVESLRAGYDYSNSKKTTIWHE